MNKTLTVNLGGTVYRMNEDAYRLLNDYLSNLKVYFDGRQGAEEIVKDIENRVYELFSERFSQPHTVLTLADVEEVVARIGNPEDFGDTENENRRNAENTQQVSADIPETKTKRRLYRDADHGILGGVASGLAACYGWDATFVRLVMVVLGFIPYCPVILFYIFAWIVIPKMQMSSGAVTANRKDGVAQKVKAKPMRKSLKILLIVVTSIGCLWLLLSVFIGFCAVFGFTDFHLDGSGFFPSLYNKIFKPFGPIWMIIVYFPVYLVFGIPILIALYLIFRSNCQWPGMPAKVKIALLLIWMVGVLLCLVFYFTTISPKEFHNTCPPTVEETSF